MVVRIHVDWSVKEHDVGDPGAARRCLSQVAFIFAWLPASDFAYDRLRDQTLWRLGYRTIRFCNLDVLDNPEGVLAVLSLEMER